MRTSTLFVVMSFGMLASLPLPAQEICSPVPSTATPGAGKIKPFTPSERAAILNLINQELATGFRLAAELSPQEIKELDDFTSKPFILQAKKRLEIPLDPNLPELWKTLCEKERRITEALIQAVETNDSQETKRKLVEKLNEHMDKSVIETFRECGPVFEAEYQKYGQYLSSIIEEIFAENPETTEGSAVRRKTIFTEIANRLEKHRVNESCELVMQDDDPLKPLIQQELDKYYEKYGPPEKEWENPVFTKTVRQDGSILVRVHCRELYMAPRPWLGGGAFNYLFNPKTKIIEFKKRDK